MRCCFLGVMTAKDGREMTPWAVEALGATRRDEKMDMLCNMVSQIVVHSRRGGQTRYV